MTWRALALASLLAAGLTVKLRWPACRHCGWRDWARYGELWVCKSCGGKR